MMYVSTEDRLNTRLHEQEEAKTMCSDGKCSHVQVIICSCSTHIDQGSIHITRPVSSSHFPPLLQHLRTTALSLPSIQDLLTAFTTACVSTLYRTDAQQSSLQTVNESLLKLQDMNISSRARKYIRNPFQIVGLAKRTRVSTQSIPSLRLLFNIAVVVIWVLVRRFAEIFGVKLPPLSLVSQSENRSAGKSSGTARRMEHRDEWVKVED